MYQNLVPKIFLNLVNSPKQLIQVRNSFEDMILEKRFSEILKNHDFIFLLKPRLFLRRILAKIKEDWI